MLNEKLQAVIDRIAKLRALATSDNQHEAETAAALAEKLIQEHRLSEADLDATSARPDEPIEEDNGSLFDFGFQLPKWEWSLASDLGRLYGIAFWVDQKQVKCDVYPYTKSGQCLRIVGRRSDVEILRYQYAFLSLEIERLTQAWASSHKFARGEARTMMNSYRLGAVKGVIDAMREASATAMGESQATGSSAAMVLVDRYKLSTQFMNAKHNLRSRGGSKSNLDYNAYGEGKSAGGRIHQGAALSGGGSHRVLGSGK